MDVDPVLVRVGFVLGAFANGIGIIGYLILWILVPQRPYAFDLYPDAEQTVTDIPEPAHRNVSPATIFGGILIAVGVMALMDNLIPSIDFGDLWPIVLVAMGAVLIFRNFQKRREEDEPVMPTTAPEEPQSSSSPLP